MTSPLALRPLTPADAEAMVSVLAAPELYAYTGGEPPTLEQLRRRYEVQARGTSPDGTQAWLNHLVLLDGRPVGYVQATIPASGEATEIAWVIGRPWQGRGLAARAGALLLEDLRARGVTRVCAHIVPGHVASERVAARLGLAPTDAVVDGETRWEGTLARRLRP